VAAPPLDSLCDGPVTYPGDTKILVKSSKGRSGPTLKTTTRSGLTNKDKESPKKVIIRKFIILNTGKTK